MKDDNLEPGLSSQLIDQTDIDLSPSLRLELAGHWSLASETLQPQTLLEQALVKKADLQHLQIDIAQLQHWDTSLVLFLIKLNEHCANKQIHCDLSQLPQNIQHMIELANSQANYEIEQTPSIIEDLFYRVGRNLVIAYQAIRNAMEFMGQLSHAFSRFLRGKASFSWQQLWTHTQQSGASAFPIVSLITFLTGLILAFIGASQLITFGAQIYTANLVAVGMTREMAAMMVGIIIAGRTGAAYAAQLGTMQVNEEIDALQTSGLSPMEFLILPRTLAVIIMMPLLCLYADILGILGGGVVGIFMMKIAPIQYLYQTLAAISLSDIIIGLIKSIFYGVAIGLASCYQGIRCGRNAMAVGKATTSAVVSGILLIIIFDAVLGILLHFMGY